jgi:SRSO17 transposase
MIETLTLEHFSKVRSTVKDPAALARLRNFVASLKEEDNPVIVIAHLK